MKNKISIKIKVGGKKIAKGIAFVVLGVLAAFAIGYFFFIGSLV